WSSHGRSHRHANARCSSVTRTFFFQAEDGIRDSSVTGVQTCALPISCLREILNEAHWANWEYCLKQARTPLGKEIVLQKLRQLWSNRTIKELQHYALQFYLVALCTNAVLTTVGKSFYKFDEATELQIKLHEQYGRDIYMLEIGIMDLAHDVFADDEAHAYEIATFKDERMAPLVQDMFRHLTATKE